MGAIAGYGGGDSEDGRGWAGAQGGTGDWLVCRWRVGAFTDFHQLGLGIPLHRFARSLLFFYDLHLHDLTLEGVFQIMTFITLCEAFLGIHPHFVLWRRLF
jgi:hypothetical protein